MPFGVVFRVTNGLHLATKLALCSSPNVYFVQNLKMTILGKIEPKLNKAQTRVEQLSEGFTKTGLKTWLHISHKLL